MVDQGFGKIRPRARLIRALGEELISNEIVAILELVRNCYDADAHLVEIHFSDPHRPESASLEIRDDGHGMPKEVLLGPWLEPATDHKSSEASGPYAGDRSPGGRRRLGSKGVGRFATRRLGRHLALCTRTDSRHELQADFDWQILEEQGRFLDQLRIVRPENSCR